MGIDTMNFFPPPSSSISIKKHCHIIKKLCVRYCQHCDNVILTGLRAAKKLTSLSTEASKEVQEEFSQVPIASVL